MTDAEAHQKTNDRIERFYAKGSEMVEQANLMPDGEEANALRDQGLEIFLAGMDIACRATANAIEHQKRTNIYS